MTEDDTFKKLAQTPFLKMANLLYEYCKKRNFEYIRSAEDFLKIHHWTVEEFNIASEQYYKPRL
jgi:hypothetical protein